MKNSKHLLCFLCLLLLGSQVTFAQENEKSVHLSLRFSPSGSNAHYSGSPIAESFNNDYLGLSSTLGIGIDIKLLRGVYLTTGVEYVSLTEVILKEKSFLLDSQIQDTVLTISRLVGKSRLNYVAIPIGIKLMISDNAKMNFYVTSSVSGMYKLNGKNISIIGDEVHKMDIENSNGIADWILGGSIGAGVEFSIFSMGKLFLEPNVVVFPRTNKPGGIETSFGVPTSINRMMYTGGIALGLKF